MVPDSNYYQRIPLVLVFLRALFLVLHFSYYILMTFLVSNIDAYMLFTLYSKCDQALDLSQQLEQASELKSGLQDTVDWGRRWFTDFNAEKNHPNNCCTCKVIVDWPVVNEKPSFIMLALSLSFKLDWGSKIVSIPQSVPKKIIALIHSVKFVSFEVTLYLYKSSNWPCTEYYCHVRACAPTRYKDMLDYLTETGLQEFFNCYLTAHG